jgi:hypothetical protein
MTSNERYCEGTIYGFCAHRRMILAFIYSSTGPQHVELLYVPDGGCFDCCMPLGRVQSLLQTFAGQAD